MTISKLYKIFQQNPIICTDTRKLKKGSIFFSLKGDNFNGNEYAIEAANNGCCYSIIDEKTYDTHPKMILVKNVLETLQELAIYHRKKLTIPIIGITGSNGKTTSKEIINCVLNSEKKCYSTKGNLNNHIGVPLSILEITLDHKIAIIEMGANHYKEISFLCNIAKPTHGIITNIGLAHLEGFKNLNGIIKTKNELYQSIKKNNGLLFVNSEDKLLLDLSKSISKITYGESGKIKGKIKQHDPFMKVEFESCLINSHLIGSFQFTNIMLAICVGIFFNISKKNIKKAIEGYKPKNNRSQIIKTSRNLLILDAYNANPSSMKAMLTSFAKHKKKNKFCILGDMLELGKESKKEHEKIINLCMKLKLDCYYVGEEFKKVNPNAFSKREELETLLKQNDLSNKKILIKGSRALNLEKLTDLL